MVWHFRNDLREQGRAPRESYPGQPSPQKLRALEVHQLDALAGAVAVMLEDRFTAVIEDPELGTRLDALPSSWISCPRTGRSWRQDAAATAAAVGTGGLGGLAVGAAADVLGDAIPSFSLVAALTG